MKDLKPDRDANQLSTLAGADPTAARSQAAAATRRSRRLRALAIVVVVVGALAVIIGPHLYDHNRISSVADRAADEARGDAPAVSCPPTPIARNAVKPTSAVVLRAAVICHYPRGQAGTRPVEGPVPASQLSGISADMNTNTISGPLSAAPGLALNGTNPEDWVVVAVTAKGEQVQLVANPYPSAYTWDGLGPGLVWHPSIAVRQLLAGDLPR